MPLSLRHAHWKLFVCFSSAALPNVSCSEQSKSSRRTQRCTTCLGFGTSSRNASSPIYIDFFACHHTISLVTPVRCFEVASLSWLKRQAATALFGAPPTATYTEAAGRLLESERLAVAVGRPMFSNRLKLAQTYRGAFPILLHSNEACCGGGMMSATPRHCS